MPSMPALTIVMPSRNRGHLLHRTLRALDRQEGIEPGDFELVIVLDGDQSGAAQLLGGLETGFPVRVLEQPQSGAAAARNRGWREARAGLVLFLDDDMEASRHLVRAHLEAARLNPRAALVGSFSLDPAQPPSAWEAYESAVHEQRQRSYAAGEELSGIRCYTGNLLVPRALLAEVGGFDTSLRRNEDVDLGYRLQSAGARLVYVAEALAHHCGRHPFQAWRRAARAYGELEIELFRERGYGGGVEASIAGFHDRNLLNRVAVRASLSHPAAARTMVAGARAVGVAAQRAGLRQLSYAAMSCVSNVEFWNGVATAVGGAESLGRLIKSTRDHPTRTYDSSRMAASRPR